MVEKTSSVNIVGKVNTYRLGDKIGDGTQGEIYMAKSKEDGVSRYWAVKKFNKELMELNVKRFQNMIKEIRCLR